MNRGRNENVRQRRHQGPALLLQFLCLASSRSGQLLLLFSHPEDYDINYENYNDFGYYANADADADTNADAGNANLCFQLGDLRLQ